MRHVRRRPPVFRATAFRATAFRATAFRAAVSPAPVFPAPVFPASADRDCTRGIIAPLLSASQPSILTGATLASLK